jgi:lactate racemase
MLLQRYDAHRPLSPEDIDEAVHTALAAIHLRGKRVLFIIPDGTRSMPMPAMFPSLCHAVREMDAHGDFMIALGTHPPMTEESICRMIGLTPAERRRDYGEVQIYNHEWQNPDALIKLGTISEDEIEAISGGLMRRKADVFANKRIQDYDVLCVVGPVFPHEVVGFSGGNKYFFPGIAGEDIVNLFHWLGALITNPVINGVKETPVRAVIDRAAALVEKEKWAFCLNVMDSACQGLFFGSPEEAWSAAADVALQSHIIYKHHPYHSVLSMAPLMYDDIWVAGKCMYKLEMVVADGGELIIYGPHVREISYTHGDRIRRIGYHTRDYFLAQMERFADVPGAIMAHSTHVRGIGTFENDVERPRIRVTLATGIPKEECLSVNLGYRDPASIEPEDWRDRETDGVLLAPHAGEMLYRLIEGNPQPTPYRGAR